MDTRPQRDTHSPYSGWYDPQQLTEEADRLRNLPPANNIVQRWRRHRLWRIEQRVQEIYYMRRNA